MTSTPAASAFETLRLVNGYLSGARLEKLRLDDCELTRSELANLEGRGAQAARVRVRESRTHRDRVP